MADSEHDTMTERATMDRLARDMRLSAKERAIAEEFTRAYLTALSYPRCRSCLERLREGNANLVEALRRIARDRV